MKLIFAVLDVSSTMGLTRCYKTEGFYAFICYSYGTDNNKNHDTYSVDDVAVVIADVPDRVHSSFIVSTRSASLVPSAQYMYRTIHNANEI